MPGLESPDAAGKNPYTGMPFPLSHPFNGPTPDMNTGRGCDIYGKPYKPPARYVYLNIHRFSEEVEDYEITKSYEVDFGPSIDSEEFQEGLRIWKESEDFIAYEAEQQVDNPQWEWKDPQEEAPWELCQLVTPNPWLTPDYIVKDPLEQHITKIQEWAERSHQPWPSWERPAELDEGRHEGAPAAIQDGPRSEE